MLHGFLFLEEDAEEDEMGNKTEEGIVSNEAQLARTIYEVLGDKENIIYFSNCTTRS